MNVNECQLLENVFKYIYTKVKDDGIKVYYNMDEDDKCINDVYLTITYEFNGLFLGEISFTLNCYLHDNRDYLVDYNDYILLKDFTLRMLYKVVKYYA